MPPEIIVSGNQDGPRDEDLLPGRSWKLSSTDFKPVSLTRANLRRR